MRKLFAERGRAVEVTIPSPRMKDADALQGKCNASSSRRHGFPSQRPSLSASSKTQLPQQ